MWEFFNLAILSFVLTFFHKVASCLWKSAGNLKMSKKLRVLRKIRKSAPSWRKSDISSILSRLVSDILYFELIFSIISLFKSIFQASFSQYLLMSRLQEIHPIPRHGIHLQVLPSTVDYFTYFPRMAHYCLKFGHFCLKFGWLCLKFAYFS